MEIIDEWGRSFWYAIAVFFILDMLIDYDIKLYIQIY
jgi:hypothetical protein